MTTKRKLRTRNVREDLPPGTIELLKTGNWHGLRAFQFYLGALRHGPRSELAEYWRELKPTIMKEFRGRRRRPWAVDFLEEDKP